MDLVKSVIDDWDPVDLLIYAPNDEYDLEIKEIRNLLSKTDDATQLAKGIFTIFLESFGKEVFKKNEAECKKIAQLLLLQNEHRT